MSSHREAPEIAKDPVADSTDLYASVSPDRPGTVTLIANYLPLEGPAGGRTSMSSATMCSTRSTSTHTATVKRTSPMSSASTPNCPIRTRSSTTPGPSRHCTSPNWNRRQAYSVTRRDGWGQHRLGEGLICPPCNIGPLSTPDYAALAGAAVHTLSDGSRVFAGATRRRLLRRPRLDIRPRRSAAIPELPGLRQGGGSAAPGVNTPKFLNVHSIALQVPISRVTEHHRPVIGVWTTASRRRARILDAQGTGHVHSGPHTQVSRLGNPLFNEVIVPLGKKDYWNTQRPVHDKQFAHYVAHPELTPAASAIPGSVPAPGGPSQGRETPR